MFQTFYITRYCNIDIIVTYANQTAVDYMRKCNERNEQTIENWNEVEGGEGMLSLNFYFWLFANHVKVCKICDLQKLDHFI